MGASPLLILGSGSPRRRELLTAAGLSFEVEVAGVDEDLPEPRSTADGEPAEAPWGDRAEEAATVLAERKARAVAEAHAGENVLVLGADTIVVAHGRLLGKPEGPAEARSMLGQLAGDRHQVVTGVSVIRCLDGRVRTGWERTWVTMRALSPEEIEAYVSGGEWADKAGGYGIQGAAGAFVTGLEEGGQDNVVGLPVALSLGLLGDQGASLPGTAPGGGARDADGTD